MGGEGDRQVSAGSAGVGGHRPVVASAGAERVLAAEAGDRKSRSDARHAQHPGAGGRDILHYVQPRAGRALLRATLRHDAVHAARGRSHQGDLAEAHRRTGACDGRRRVFVDRGRVSRRLLQCADGSDQPGLLRGSDAGELPAPARRSVVGTSGQKGVANRPSLVGAGRRPDVADDALWSRRPERSDERRRPVARERSARQAAGTEQ